MECGRDSGLLMVTRWGVHGYTVYSYDTHMHVDKQCTAPACHILLWVISHASTIGSCRSENGPNCLRLQTLISLCHCRLAFFLTVSYTSSSASYVLELNSKQPSTPPPACPQPEPNFGNKLNHKRLHPVTHVKTQEYQGEMDASIGCT